MTGPKHTPERIVRKLRTADLGLATQSIEHGRIRHPAGGAGPSSTENLIASAEVPGGK